MAQLTLRETAKEIKLILDCVDYVMNNKNKIEAIYVLVESEMEETYFLTNIKKIRQQIISEILYLFEKFGKNNKTTERYIENRIKNCIKNCIQNGWIIPRKKKEINVEYLENLQGNLLEVQMQKRSEKTKKKTRKTRKKGWHRKTEQRLERLLLSSTTKSKKRKYVVQPLFAAA